MEPTIKTLTGEIKPAELGVTRMHEHLFTLPPPVKEKDDPDLILDDAAPILRELEALHQAGVSTLVEGTAIDYGRQVEAMAGIARKTPVMIVATTGFNRGIFFPEWIHNAGREKLTRLLVEELTRGMEGTSLRAGILKAGTDYQRITLVEEKALQAVARAHLETNAPVQAHTEAGTMALEQLEIFRREGVPLERVVLIHMDRNPDYRYHRRVLEQGANIMYDGPGKIKYFPDEVRVELLKRLIKEGYTAQIFLSNDMGRKSYLQAYGGGPGWLFLHRSFIPRLLEEGVTPEQIEQIMVDNPQRFLPF